MLRQSFSATSTLALNQPRVLLNNAAQKFEERGRLTDEPTWEHLCKLLESPAAVGYEGCA